MNTNCTTILIWICKRPSFHIWKNRSLFIYHLRWELRKNVGSSDDEESKVPHSMIKFNSLGYKPNLSIKSIRNIRPVNIQRIVLATRVMPWYNVSPCWEGSRFLFNKVSPPPSHPHHPSHRRHHYHHPAWSRHWHPPCWIWSRPRYEAA